MEQNKKDYYEIATKKLISQVSSMKLVPETLDNAIKYISLFRDNFKLNNVQLATFADMNESLKFFDYDSVGFCKSASYSFQQIMGNQEWILMYINHIWTYGPHYFLRHNKTQQNFDLTFDQYTHAGIKIPYYLGQKITNPKAKDYKCAFDFAKSIGIDLTKFNER